MRSSLLDVRVKAKRYGTRDVLQRTAFSLAHGEIMSLVGPSGCGKSTLLRIVAGLDRAFEGDVTLNGVALHSPSPDIGVIFQEPRLLPWLNVADNIAFAAGRNQGKDPRVAQLLESVSLSNVQSALPKQLSGGMAQRVALARGLFTRPKLLLLDEPFSAVDAMTRMRLQDVLLQLVQANPVSALLVTHDLDEALYLSDRILLMNVPDTGQGAGIAREIVVDTPRPRDRRTLDGKGLRAGLLEGLLAPQD